MLLKHFQIVLTFGSSTPLRRKLTKSAKGLFHLNYHNSTIILIKMDFPVNGEAPEVAAWLTEAGFEGCFPDFSADDLLGLSEKEVLRRAGDKDGGRLWGRLTTAKNHNAGNTYNLSKQTK